MRHMHQQMGFTLIELMVVVAVFVVLASLALPSFTDMIENNRTRNAAESILAGMQIARAEAVKRNTNVQFDLQGANSAWRVCTSPTAPGGCSASGASMIQIRKAGEGSSDNINVVPSDGGPYVFNGLGVMTSPTPTGDLVNINISNAAHASGRDLRVEVGAGGSVKVCDPALTAASDPRKCS